MTWKRLYQTLNFPWIHGPVWWRARRFSNARARQMHAEHIAWAAALAAETRRP